MSVAPFPLRVSGDNFLNQQLPDALGNLYRSLNASELDQQAIATLKAIKELLVDATPYQYWWTMDTDWAAFGRLIPPLVQILRACEATHSEMMREYLKQSLVRFDQEVKHLREQYYGAERASETPRRQGLTEVG